MKKSFLLFTIVWVTIPIMGANKPSNSQKNDLQGKTPFSIPLSRKPSPETFHFKLKRGQRLNQSNHQKSLDSLETSYFSSFEGKNWRGRTNLDLKYLIQKGSKINFSLSQAYINTSDPKEPQSHYTLGRQILDWSPEEKFWQLDHINGLRSFNLMDTKQEGLLGLLYSTRSGRMRTQIFASLFYLPSLNPRIHVKNGNITTSSGWAQTPPKITSVADREVNIYYELNTPNISDIFVQKSLGLNLETYVNPHIKLSSFAVYKPENSIRANAEAFYEFEKDRVLVKINPIVNHHLVMGLQTQANIKDRYSLRGGLTYVDPNAKMGKDFDTLTLKINKEQNNFESDFFKIEPKYEEELYTHASLGFKKPLFSIAFNALHYITKHGRGSDDLYSETTRWKTALGLEGTFSMADRWSGHGSIRYDLVRKDNLANIGVIYQTPSSFSIGLSAELLRSPKRESYWSFHRANDTFFTYVSYSL